jgi:curved DNA-binding protein CbpA
MSLRSYEILGLRPDANVIQVKNAFKKLALTTHPDKGGTSELFAVIKAAYVDISKLMNFNYLDFTDLKNESRRATTSQQSDIDNRPTQKFNNKKFNKMFEKHRPADHGYNLREIPNTREIDYAKCVIKYTEPDLIHSSGNYTNLNGGICSDYTAPFNSKIKYTDCVRAFATPLEEEELIDRSIIRPSSIADLVIQRDQPMVLSENDISQYNHFQRIKLEEERLRQDAEEQLNKENIKRYNKFNSRRLQ